MIAKMCRFFLPVVLLLTCSAFAVAGQYSDPSGFSFTYPDGWTLLNSEIASKPDANLPPEIKKGIEAGIIDLNSVTVMVMHVGQDDYMNAFNVVVAPEQIPVEQSHLSELAAMFKKQYGAEGMTMSNYQSRIEKINARDVYVVDFNLQETGDPAPQRLRQVLVPGGGKTYILTFTSLASAFASYQGTFDQVVNSFHAPAPLATSSSSRSTRFPIRLIVFGIAGLFGLFAWVKNKLMGD